MILYTVKNGVYYNLEDFKEDLSDLGENGFPNKIYINMTNRCSCSCTFCFLNFMNFPPLFLCYFPSSVAVDLSVFGFLPLLLICSFVFLYN